MRELKVLLYKVFAGEIVYIDLGRNVLIMGKEGRLATHRKGEGAVKNGQRLQCPNHMSKNTGSYQRLKEAMDGSSPRTFRRKTDMLALCVGLKILLKFPAPKEMSEYISSALS